jgi:hypothetical protein
MSRQHLSAGPTWIVEWHPLLSHSSDWACSAGTRTRLDRARLVPKAAHRLPRDTVRAVARECIGSHPPHRGAGKSTPRSMPLKTTSEDRWPGGRITRPRSGPLPGRARDRDPLDVVHAVRSNGPMGPDVRASGRKALQLVAARRVVRDLEAARVVAPRPEEWPEASAPLHATSSSVTPALTAGLAPQRYDPGDPRKRLDAKHEHSRSLRIDGAELCLPRSQRPGRRRRTAPRPIHAQNSLRPVSKGTLWPASSRRPRW